MTHSQNRDFQKILLELLAFLTFSFRPYLCQTIWESRFCSLLSSSLRGGGEFVLARGQKRRRTNPQFIVVPLPCAKAKCVCVKKSIKFKKYVVAVFFCEIVCLFLSLVLLFGIGKHWNDSVTCWVDCYLQQLQITKYTAATLPVFGEREGSVLCRR